MRLKLYRAASVAEAMALVRAELGTEALILSTRRISQGVELTAALEPGDEPPAGWLPREAASAALPPGRSACEAPAAPAPPIAETGSGGPVARTLAFHGLPASLAARLAGPDLAGALRAALRFGTLPLVRDGPPLLLAGMPGAGKTLSVARLATRLVLAGIAPLVITADGRRAGAAEELAAYTRLLGLGLVAASTPATLARALAQRAPDTPVLIDTPGTNPFDAAELAGLQALAEAASAACVLVMAAGQDLAEATEQAQAFLPVGIRHLLPTRLDLTRRLGSMLGAADASGLILTEAGIGPGATDGLALLTPDMLAARLGPTAEAAAFPTPWAPGLPGAAPAGRPAGRSTDWIRA